MNVIAMTEGNPAVFRNKTDLKKFVRTHDDASNGDLVEAINLKLNLSVFVDNESHHHRLDAGRMLLELRTRVEAEGGDWWKWQIGRFDRSRKDMEKLMRMASADEPEAAVQAEREVTRTRMKKLRRNGANLRSKPDDPPSDVNHILNLVRALTDDQRADLFTKRKESGPGRGVPQSPGLIAASDPATRPGRASCRSRRSPSPIRCCNADRLLVFGLLTT